MLQHFGHIEEHSLMIYILLYLQVQTTPISSVPCASVATPVISVAVVDLAPAEGWVRGRG